MAWGRGFWQTLNDDLIDTINDNESSVGNLSLSIIKTILIPVTYWCILDKTNISSYYFPIIANNLAIL